MASGSHHLKVVQRREGRSREEAVRPAARHREICESIAELLVLRGQRAGGGILGSEERRGRPGEDLVGVPRLGGVTQGGDQPPLVAGIDKTRRWFDELCRELGFRTRIAGGDD